MLACMTFDMRLTDAWYGFLLQTRIDYIDYNWLAPMRPTLAKEMLEDRDLADE